MLKLVLAIVLSICCGFTGGWIFWIVTADKNSCAPEPLTNESLSDRVDGGLDNEIRSLRTRMLRLELAQKASGSDHTNNSTVNNPSSDGKDVSQEGSNGADHAAKILAWAEPWKSNGNAPSFAEQTLIDVRNVIFKARPSMELETLDELTTTSRTYLEKRKLIVEELRDLEVSQDGEGWNEAYDRLKLLEEDQVREIVRVTGSESFDYLIRALNAVDPFRAHLQETK